MNDQLLFIFEMANNHQGDVELGKKIISTYASIAKKQGVMAAIKFQFRDLDTFIHPDYQDSDLKYVKRFQSTRLSKDQFMEMVLLARAEGIKVISTPFDEVSVDFCVDADVDAIKIASCSANDWPLLEAASRAGKELIVSTGGLEMGQIDRLVGFLETRSVEYSLLHCVGLYPTPPENLNLDFITWMKARFGCPIGYSGHEDPDHYDVGKMAIAKGATILERHVGVKDLNAYSMNPCQTQQWIKEVLEAKTMCQVSNPKVSHDELATMHSLQRGVYAKREIQRLEEITPDDVFYALPRNGISSGQFYGHQLKATSHYEVNKPLREAAVLHPNDGDKYGIKYDVLSVLRDAGVNYKGTIELSHHYGLDQFRAVGAAIVNIINENEYCKKIIVVLPGQVHPIHWHKVKKETFIVQWGEGVMVVDGEDIAVKADDIIHILPGMKHGFRSATGMVFEEVSTQHLPNDSFYSDENVPLEGSLRKTFV